MTVTRSTNSTRRSCASPRPLTATVTYVAGLYYFYKHIDQHFTRYIDLYGIDFAPAPRFRRTLGAE